MKKYFEATPNLDGLKEKIIVLKDGEDRKTLIAVIALVAAVLIADNGRCGLSSENKNG